MMRSAVYANYSHQKKSREPMFNIHEMATMWPMQTLGSFDLLEKRVIRKGDVFFMPLLQEYVISTEIMLSLLISNKMINLYLYLYNLKTRTKLKHTNITKFKNKEIKILNRSKLITKTKKNIKFSTYHVNICTDMGYNVHDKKKPICKTF